MQRKEVESSNIKSVGYCKTQMIMEVEFHNGRVYRYQPISEEGYHLLMNAESIGKFFNRNIKNNEIISCEEVT